ncbi:MAG: hypothetical protein RL711_1876 [Bacteroidota bacterium]
MKTYLSILLFLLIHLAQAQPLLPVEINNKWGFINAEGKVVIDAKYELPIEFNDHGLAIAVSHQKYGIINQLGIEVIPPHYQELMWLSNTLLSYRKEALWGVINLKEQTIIPAQFLEIAIADNFIHAYASHHHSIFNLSGKNIIAPTNFIVKKLANKRGSGMSGILLLESSLMYSFLSIGGIGFLLICVGAQRPIPVQGLFSIVCSHHLLSLLGGGFTGCSG